MDTCFIKRCGGETESALAHPLGKMVTSSVLPFPYMIYVKTAKMKCEDGLGESCRDSTLFADAEI